MTDMANMKEMLSNLSPEERKKLFEEYMKPSSSEQSEIEELKKKVMALCENKSSLKRGDIVQWKKGLSNRKLPAEGQCAIVIEVLKDKNLQQEKDSGSPYYREPLNLALAILDSKSDLVIYHYDKRRFEKVDSLILPEEPSERSSDSE